MPLVIHTRSGEREDEGPAVPYGLGYNNIPYNSINCGNFFACSIGKELHTNSEYEAVKMKRLTK